MQYEVIISRVSEQKAVKSLKKLDHSQRQRHAAIKQTMKAAATVLVEFCKTHVINSCVELMWQINNV